MSDTIKTTPFAWLHPGEISEEMCGCRMDWQGPAIAQFHMCAKHRAAQELLKACKAANELIAMAYSHISHGGPTRADAEHCLRILEAAIAKAEGR